MEKAYILMDVGGTEIKCGIADEKGNISQPLMKFPAKSMAQKNEILDNFANIIKSLIKEAKHSIVAGIGMAFPGPFDYEHGICLMHGLNKYDNIYGVSLIEAIRSRVPETMPVKFLFLHDVEAFAVGESWFGECYKAHRIFCLCIGTGAGSAFVEQRNIVRNGAGVPENGWVYNIPFKKTVIDDYISVRGLTRLSKHFIGCVMSGREMYELSCEGDLKAKRAFEVFGSWLNDAILPILDDFTPDAMVLGGQISGSFTFFGTTFQKECQNRNIKLILEKETSEKAMKGLYVSMDGR